jgi:DNA-binding PadR family transcriptional regulator
MSKYELVVMGFLLDEPMHGYQINQLVKVHRMDSWAKISPPMIYKTLGSLEDQGMVSSRREREGLMPERRVYSLTSKGRERLARLVEKSLLDKNITYDLSNLGYFFIFALDKEKALDCLKQKKVLLEKTIRSLRKRMEEYRGKTPVNRFLVLEKDHDRFRSELHHLNVMLDRVERCQEWSQVAFLEGGEKAFGGQRKIAERG